MPSRDVPDDDLALAVTHNPSERRDCRLPTISIQDEELIGKSARAVYLLDFGNGVHDLRGGHVTSRIVVLVDEENTGMAATGSK